MDTKRIIRFAVAPAVIVTGICSIWLISSLNRLETPQPTGKHSVGRVRLNLKGDLHLEQFDPQRPREVIIRKIVELDVAGHSLLEEHFEQSEDLLHSAAVNEFGSWETALEYAGVSAHNVRRCRDLSPERVTEAIKPTLYDRLRPGGQGEPLTGSGAIRCRCPTLW